MLRVRLFSGSLVSRPSADVLAGANALALDHGGGAWEVVAFRTATLVSAGVNDLTGLVGGARGTEGAAGSSLAAGARVVVLDAAVAAAGMAPDDVGRPFWYRHGPASEGLDGEKVRTVAHTFAGIGRRPFAPCHLEARPDGSGGWSLSWIRRSRLAGDGWGSEPVPLGEAAELYRLEIGPAGAPVRTVDVAAPTWTYSASALAADGLAGPIPWRVAQVSDTFGPGAFAAALIPE